MKNEFTHLHVHSEYSMLDGAARISDMVQKVVQQNQRALGLTDHGNMYGALTFYEECKKAGINPIIGLEAYMSSTSRFEKSIRKGSLKDGSTDKLYFHITLLAIDNEGYKNLIKLSSRSFLEGYYYKPRVDFDLLASHSKGIIATTGCLGSIVLQRLLAGDYSGALENAGRLKDIFGSENFFVEIQDHGISDQKRTNPELIRLAKDLNVGLLATNDTHYVNQADWEGHDALLCVQTRSTIHDEKRFKFESREHYLKDPREMWELFGDLEDSLNNTMVIAERANINLEIDENVLPHIDLPEEYKKSDYQTGLKKYLRDLTYNGAKKRYGAPLEQTVKERLDYELRIINEMGFDAYFIVVWDLIRYAKTNNIRVGPGRGSAAGCLVAYCLEIVDIDPIKYGLIFERFLNPGRRQMPDIDMDFDERYRGEMIKYASRKYGSDHVAQIITFSTIKARAAVRDAARVLGHPYSLGDKIAKLMPPLVMGRDTPLHACFERDPQYEDGYLAAKELRDLYESNAEAKRVIDVARSLEGLRRQDGIHAAAVVISDKPLTEYLPIQRKPEDPAKPDDAPIVTQFEMHDVEKLGLLKMDFLGLRTLSIIDNTLQYIKASMNTELDLERVDLADKATFDMLCRGETIGVFQLEGAQMRSLIKQLRPTSFQDVAALVALYRPGPMAANMHKDYADRKNGRKKVTYLHPDMEEILHETYGLMIYQESMMRIAQKFAGYSLEEADNLRKACGKKDRELIQKERARFKSGCKKNGYGEELGDQIFDLIEPFADYAFNKSHSFGYGLLAYQTAYLKANFPVCYMAAMLNAAKDDKDRCANYLGECRRMGILVSVPSINKSDENFTPIPESSEITFGLSGIRNVGSSVVKRILSARSSGEFSSFEDFVNRVDQTVLNKRTIESLIKAGAFDCLGYSRKGLCDNFEKIAGDAESRKKMRASGALSLFAEPELSRSIDIPTEDYAARERLDHEKEMLGTYVSEHPLSQLVEKIRELGVYSIGDLITGGEAEGAVGYVKVAGVASSIKKRTTKQGESMASFTLEDLSGAITVFLFPRSYEKNYEKVVDGRALLIEGKFDKTDEEMKLIAQSISEISDDGSLSNSKTLQIELVKPTESAINNLAQLLSNARGKTPVHLMVGSRKIELAKEYWVNPTNGLLSELLVNFEKVCLTE